MFTITILQFLEIYNCGKQQNSHGLETPRLITYAYYGKNSPLINACNFIKA